MRIYKLFSATQNHFGIGGIYTFHGCNLLKTMVICISYDCIILAREDMVHLFLPYTLLV